MTKEQAIKLGESEFWKDMTHRQIAEFQFHEQLMCMPFDVFHEALEKTLRRPVFTHELALNRDGIAAELRGDRAAPTLDEIIELIPADKRVIVVTGTR